MKNLAGIRRDIMEKLIDPLKSALIAKGQRNPPIEDKYTEMDHTLKELLSKASEILRQHYGPSQSKGV
jgi:hypothetical protein